MPSVQSELHPNWIAGVRRPAASELDFEFAARAEPWEVLARFPRSSAEDVREACEACAIAFAPWVGLQRWRRVAFLRRAQDALEADAALAGELARSLALEPVEAAAISERDLFHAREALEIAVDAVDTRAGTGLFLAHWSDRTGPLLSRIFARLAAGSTVTLIADPLLPLAAEALVRALEAADLPPGVVNVVHDDGLTAAETALGLPTFSWIRAAGTEEKLARLLPRAAQGAELASWPIQNRSFVVRDAAEPKEAARAVVEQSLSRLVTLSGQLPGQVGRVLCPSRTFSLMCEELLAELERSPDVQNPVPLLEPDALEALREAWALGLDEGATPLMGGEPWYLDEVQDGGGDPGGVARGERRSRGRGGVVPCVFTNVGPEQRLARLTRAQPVLCLLRVESEEAAVELARAHDAGGRGASVRG